MAAVELVGALTSADTTEVQQALVSIQSLALDDGDSLLAVGGCAALCAVLGRPTAADESVREAALCLFLLMEEDHSAVEAVVAAGGAHALTSVLNRPLSAAAAEWVRSALDCLPAESVALASRGARLGAMDAIAAATVQTDSAEKQGRECEMGEYKLMRRTVSRAGSELDSKRGLAVEAGLVVQPIASATLDHGFVRLQLQDGSWVSECGMDGRIICERIDERDGLTESERAEYVRLERLAAEEAAELAKMQEETERKAAFFAQEAERRRKMDELAQTFSGLRGQLADLQKYVCLPVHCNNHSSTPRQCM